MTQPQQEFIGTVDIHDLRQLHWPLMRLLAPHFVEELELGRYMKGLLATGRWRDVRVVPHRSATGELSKHVFDVYGETDVDRDVRPPAT